MVEARYVEANRSQLNWDLVDLDSLSAGITGRGWSGNLPTIWT